MIGNLSCPYCGCPVWSSDEGARCTDPDHASGARPEDRSCGATWDSVGVLDTPPREERTMRNFRLVTKDDQPRGDIRATHPDAVAAANAVSKRTGEKVYVEYENARFVPGGKDERR